MILALFDVDGTLIAEDTFKLFCGLAIKRSGLRIGRALDFARVLTDWAFGRADAGSLKAACLRLCLPHNGALPRLVDEFVENVVMPRLRKKAAERLAWHKQQKHRIVLVSASPDLYLNRLAAALAADDVVCTKTLRGDGLFAGDLIGRNCKGQEKRTRLLSEYPHDKVSWRDSYGYGNSADDISFMELVGHPGAVNPDARLKALALRRGWEVVDWR
jgi:phosphatidylglycerophosphatase C